MLQYTYYLHRIIKVAGFSLLFVLYVFFLFHWWTLFLYLDLSYTFPLYLPSKRHFPRLDNFLLKGWRKTFELLYPAISRLQGLKNKRCCCGFNILLASRNREVRVTRGQQFAKWKTWAFSEDFGKCWKRAVFSKVQPRKWYPFSRCLEPTFTSQAFWLKSW